MAGIFIILMIALATDESIKYDISEFEVIWKSFHQHLQLKHKTRFRINTLSSTPITEPRPAS